MNRLEVINFASPKTIKLIKEAGEKALKSKLPAYQSSFDPIKYKNMVNGLRYLSESNAIRPVTAKRIYATQNKIIDKINKNPLKAERHLNRLDKFNKKFRSVDGIKNLENKTEDSLKLKYNPDEVYAGGLAYRESAEKAIKFLRNK